jgi:UDP-3-O-[3-hydroxymyristoyl] glucosamine N-acyltransferase
MHDESSTPTTRVAATADVDPSARIGAGTSVWHLAQIGRTPYVGENCNIGRGAYVGPEVTLGNNVKLAELCARLRAGATGRRCLHRTGGGADER